MAADDFSGDIGMDDSCDPQQEPQACDTTYQDVPSDDTDGPGAEQYGGVAWQEPAAYGAADPLSGMGNPAFPDSAGMADLNMLQIHDLLQPDRPDGVGTPEMDTLYWEHQTTGFTCAVEAQRGIIEAFTGEHVSEAQLVYEATAHGWLTDQGTSMEDAGNLLELHGIATHTVRNATVEDLVSELAQGHKIIVGVDSGELWNQAGPLDDFFHHAADHAISVTGIRQDADGSWIVTVNDSGVPNGAGNEYPLSAFMDAWEDSGFHYIATDHAPDNIEQCMAGFDINNGYHPQLIAAVEQMHPGFLDRHRDGTMDERQMDCGDFLDRLSEDERNRLLVHI